MRDLTTQYPRHTIRRAIRPDLTADSRTGLRSIRNSADYFFVFCRQVLPKLEERIEKQLLNKFKETLLTQKEKTEVERAWIQRKDNLAKVPELIDPGEPEPAAPELFLPVSEYKNVVQSVHGDGLSDQTYNDIGRYTIFPNHMAKRMFPTTYFGRYEKEEYKYNQTLALQTREEALRITNDLGRLTVPKDRNVNYDRLAALKNYDMKEFVLKDEDSYVALY
mmetsp:Transcript_16953/g.26108  ORF Transcript_16953/g.26108 Transcript_16953/m.26108 type:complete len:221 (+) Transcript_16953:59-721(+)